MYFHQNLRVQLQQRQNRLYKSTHRTYQSELTFLLQFIDKTPYLRALCSELDGLHPQIHWPQWRDEHVSFESVSLPGGDEAARAKVCYGLIRECAEHGKAFHYAQMMSRDKSYDGRVRAFTELIVDPFINYLHDRIDEGNNVLYVMEKYKRRTEWFHREALLAKLPSDSRRSERSVDAHLREYLFDQGIEYPFSTPSSPSGEADVVADVGEERPLVVEVKLFDPDRGYDRVYIRQGFRQIYEYANDYGQSTGHLVVFNCTPVTLTFRIASPETLWPPRIDFDNRAFFIITVDLALHERSASKRGALQPYVIDEAYLTSAVSDGDASIDGTGRASGSV